MTWIRAKPGLEKASSTVNSPIQVGHYTQRSVGTQNTRSRIDELTNKSWQTCYQSTQTTADVMSLQIYKL